MARDYFFELLKTFNIMEDDENKIMEDEDNPNDMERILFEFLVKS